jgi:GntR family transcriptional regulator
VSLEDDLAGLSEELVALAERLGDLALERLREAVDPDNPQGPAAATDERRITRARRSVEKAALLLEKFPKKILEKAPSAPPSVRLGATSNSTMNSSGIDSADITPLHEQVAAEIRRAIADGEAKCGDRLPPARDLAAVLEVNANTVLRGLRALRDEGLVEFRRGRGVTVTGQAAGRSAVVEKAKEFVRFSRRHGYRTEEILQIIQQVS